ncbi:MAG: hypothetical protein M3264_07235 [Thermoproteota archaeon]|nr:hypothetical protein [Thermoproteota archaeon]
MSISRNYHRRHTTVIMMNNNANNEGLDRQSVSLRDVRSFPVIIFVVSLMVAAIINTQAGMKPIAIVLAFFALANLIIGISVQLMRMRK